MKRSVCRSRGWGTEAVKGHATARALTGKRPSSECRKRESSDLRGYKIEKRSSVRR